jgi:hypothetical protein
MKSGIDFLLIRPRKREFPQNLLSDSHIFFEAVNEFPSVISGFF